MPATLVRNIAQIVTPLGVTGVRGRRMRELRVVERGILVISEGRFEFVGTEADLPRSLRAEIVDDIDAGGAVALPGLIDSHTHIPFAGYRESEFNRRLQGESYEQIAASGGGIAASVTATRAASPAELEARIADRTRFMALHGTTTAEAKSGYGLTLEDELKQLRAIQKANDTVPVRLVPTCLAAHEFPPEARGSRSARDEWVEEIIGRILPAVAEERLAEFCDVFVERGVFTIDEGRRILLEGARLGMIPRIHADELSDTGGAELAASVGAASADHLMHISPEGLFALAGSSTVATLLPATSFFLMSQQYAPGRALCDAGAIVALATDCNPGSSMTESMQIVMQMASLQMKMTVEEVITAATLNGAYSLRVAADSGSIEPGKRADFILLEMPNYLHLVYHFGVNLVRDVFRSGRRVVENGRVAAVSAQ